MEEELTKEQLVDHYLIQIASLEDQFKISTKQERIVILEQLNKVKKLLKDLQDDNSNT